VQLLDGLRETREYRKLKEEAIDRTLWRTCFVRGYGPVVRHTTKERKKERKKKERKKERRKERKKERKNE
jgi:hypothetical protein